MSKDKGGRPTKYREEYKEQVFKLALLGCTDEEMANILNVSKATFTNWKKDKEGFLSSINDGKEKADAEIAKSLYNRAKGVVVTETTIVESENGYTKKVTTKELPADTKAAQIWITNRQRRRWKQNPDNFNDDGTNKESNITINIGGINKPLPSSEDDIEDFTKDD